MNLAMNLKAFFLVLENLHENKIFLVSIFSFILLPRKEQNTSKEP